LLAVLIGRAPFPPPRLCAQGIFAEGKEHALAIGVTLMSSKDIRETNKGISVENTHYLNDGLYNMLSVE